MAKKQIDEFTKVIIALVILTLIVAGIIYYWDPPKKIRDIQLRNDPNFPRYVYASDKSLLAYRIAITIPDILKELPCTCGCSTIGHTSDEECFLGEHGYSPHAAHCDICQDIVIDVFQLYKRGYSIGKIHSILHKKYETNGQ